MELTGHNRKSGSRARLTSFLGSKMGSMGFRKAAFCCPAAPSSHQVRTEANDQRRPTHFGYRSPSTSPLPPGVLTNERLKKELAAHGPHGVQTRPKGAKSRYPRLEPGTPPIDRN